MTVPGQRFGIVEAPSLPKLLRFRPRYANEISKRRTIELDRMLVRKRAELTAWRGILYYGGDSTALWNSIRSLPLKAPGVRFPLVG